MTHRARLLTLAALVLALPALAQDEGFGGDAKEGEGDKATNAPETYTVQPGDTLWGLSSKFLNNPWYWPKVWSYNPQLDNPNWIRPGTVLRFYPGPTQTTVQVQPDLTAEPDPGPDEDFGDDIYVEEGVIFEGEAAKKQIAAIGVAANSTRRRLEHFVAQEDLDNAGRVLHSPEDRRMLSEYDTVYLDLKNTDVANDVLQVFRVDRDLIHPLTGENLGAVIEVVGEVRVDALADEGEHLGTITSSWESINRGDYVAKLEDIELRTIEPVPSDKEIQGVVVESARYQPLSLGEHHIIFIDQGTNNGVKPGHVFEVKRAGDPFTGKTRGLADEIIGRVMVVDARPEASTALLIYSTREIVAGDRIEMRPKDG